MAHWHEPRVIIEGWAFPLDETHRIWACFHGENARNTPLAGHFLRYEGSDALDALGWTRSQHDPQDWYELLPLEPLLAWNTDEAKYLAAPLAEVLSHPGTPPGFFRRPYAPPARPVSVMKREHPSRMLSATVARHTEARYEVRYFRYQQIAESRADDDDEIPEAWLWDWMREWIEDDLGLYQTTWCDSVDDAGRIAEIEMEYLARSLPHILRTAAAPFDAAQGKRLAKGNDIPALPS